MSDYVDRLVDAANAADGLIADLRAQLAAVTKESIRLAKIVKGLDLERFDLEAENARLRAAIEPTAETMAHIRLALRRMANWSDPLIEAILAAIADRAGVKL